MDRRTLLILSAFLPLAGACRNGAQQTAIDAPLKTFADLAKHPAPPLNNRGLIAIALPPRVGAPKAGPPATMFAVKCAACGSQRFDVRERMSMRSGGGISPRGINLVCRGCQLRTVLFDVGRDGYGGKIGGATSTSEERPVERALLGADGKPLVDQEVRYACRYNLAADEIFEMAAAEGVSPTELFDAFVLESTSDATNWRQVWDYSYA